MYSPSDHPSDEQLADLVEGRLPPEGRGPLREHLAGCTGCADKQHRLERVVALLRTEAFEDAPAAVQARAARLLSERVAGDRPGLRRRVLAALRFDSAHGPRAAGARAGRQRTRQLLFIAADHELDLRIAQADTLWAVTGQLLGPAEGGEVALHGPAAIWTVALSELGEFTMPPVPSGSYLLTIRVADLDIEVPDVMVGYTV